MFTEWCVSCDRKLLCCIYATTCLSCFFSLKLEMDPKRFYGRAIFSDSEDSELSGSDDDPECKSFRFIVCAVCCMVECRNFLWLCAHTPAAAPHRYGCTLMSVLLRFKFLPITQRHRRLGVLSDLKIQMHTVFYTCIALYFTMNFMPCISLSVSTTDIEPDRESLNDSTSGSSACSDEDEGTAHLTTIPHKLKDG